MKQEKIYEYFYCLHVIADKQIAFDLDDGVIVNYANLGDSLKTNETYEGSILFPIFKKDKYCLSNSLEPDNLRDGGG